MVLLPAGSWHGRKKSLTYFRLTQTERGGREGDRDGQTERDEIQRQTIRQRQRQRDDTDLVCDMNSASDTPNTVLAIHHTTNASTRRLLHVKLTEPTSFLLRTSAS